MNAVALPLATLILGTILGFLSTLYITTKRHRHEVALRIIDQYLEVRKELVETISNLTFIKGEEPLAEEERQELQKITASLFYKHYDFLPRPALDELVLLRVSLADYSGIIYGIKNNAVVTLSKSEVASFIDRCSLFTNAKLSAPIALQSKNATVRANEAIKLHARSVLSALNEYASIDDLLKVAERLKKKSLTGVALKEV